jgi:hypothetical protein
VRFFALTAVVCVLFLFTSTATAATLCSGGAQVITLPENTTEVSTTFECPGFQFGANAGVLLFLDPDGITPSDLVTLADVAVGSTITFVSDIDLPLTLPQVIKFQVVEPNPFVVVAASIGGGSGLKFTFSSDSNESLTGSDQFTIESAGNSGGGGNTEVPEPSTISLFGFGLLGISHLVRKKEVS